jgi:hypothetical protein
MGSWQDIVLASGNIVFAMGLIVSIRSWQLPHLSTSLLTAFWLTLFCVAYATEGLWLAAAGTSIDAVCWGVLAFQAWYWPVHLRR